MSAWRARAAGALEAFPGEVQLAFRQVHFGSAHDAALAEMASPGPSLRERRVGALTQGLGFGWPGRGDSRVPCRCTRKRRSRPRARKVQRLRDVNCRRHRACAHSRPAADRARSGTGAVRDPARSRGGVSFGWTSQRESHTLVYLNHDNAFVALPN
jgi:hypothetical protein